jgi:putative transposase
LSLARDVQVSMDGQGCALDNDLTERLWRSVKYEEVYLADYESPRAVRRGLAHYFEFYDIEQQQQALDYRTPAEVYLTPPLAKPNQSILPIC